MGLFLKSLPRLYKNAFKDLHRHFSMAFSSAVSISISLLIAILMIVSAVNVTQFTANIENEFVIQVSVLPSITRSEKSEIESRLDEFEGIKNITFSDKEQELDRLIEENGDIFRQYEGEKNPLYDVYLVEMDNPDEIKETAKKMEKIEGVVDVEYGGSTIAKLVSLFKGLRIGSAVIVVFMIALSLFLIRNSMKSAIRMRMEEIMIMRQVGAYNWYISMPFMIEGMTIGFWGALGPALLIGIGYPVLFKMMNGAFLSEMLPMIEPFPFVLWLVAGLFAAGIIVGIAGSYLAVRKYLRWTR